MYRFKNYSVLFFVFFLLCSSAIAENLPKRTPSSADLENEINEFYSKEKAYQEKIRADWLKTVEYLSKLNQQLSQTKDPKEYQTLHQEMLEVLDQTNKNNLEVLEHGVLKADYDVKAAQIRLEKAKRNLELAKQGKPSEGSAMVPNAEVFQKKMKR